MQPLKDVFAHLLVERVEDPWDLPDEEPEYFSGFPAGDEPDTVKREQAHEWLEQHASEYNEDPHQFVFDAAEAIGGPANKWIDNPKHWIYDLAIQHHPEIDRDYWRDTHDEAMWQV